MPSNILTCHDHKLRSHHGLLLTITGFVGFAWHVLFCGVRKQGIVGVC